MSLPRQTYEFYEFGPFRVDLANRILFRDGAAIPLAPKVLDALFLLIANPGRILEKGELMNQLWPDCFVEEGNLTQIVFQLRKALGESAAKQQYIETIPKRGYRFVADIKPVKAAPDQRVVYSNEPPRVLEAANGDSGADADDFLEDQKESESAVPDEVADFPSRPRGTYGPARESPWQSEATNHPRRAGANRKRIAVGAAVVSVSAAAIFALAHFLPWKLLTGGSAATKVPQVRLLTSSGKAQRPTLSQDGKYISYVIEEAGKQSVWMRPVNSTSDAQVVPPSDVFIRGVTFSPDGGFLYYVALEAEQLSGSLYQVPVLGGTPRKILSGVGSAITFSPDGKRFAFVRVAAETKEDTLITANADGSDERRLVARKSPDFFSVRGPAWSPDGKRIALSAGKSVPGDSNMFVVTVDASTGVETRLGSQSWAAAGGTAWVKDGSAVVVVAWHPDSPVFANQLWRLSYPNGEVSRVTNNLTSHYGVSIAADRDELISARSDRITRLWVAPNGDASQARLIKSGYGDNYSETFGLCWTPDNRLVYGSHASGNSDIWVMGSDGANPRQLTYDSRREIEPAASPDGRYIVYSSQGAGSSYVWRMDADGRNPKQLTRGKFDDLPTVSPDGRWVVYTSYDAADKLTLWKVSIDGGEPTQLTRQSTFSPVVSPDGKSIACLYKGEKDSRYFAAIVPFEGGEPVKIFKEMPFPAWGLARWTPDGRALTYIVTKEGVSNIWLQPVDGGKPRQLTSFKEDQIYRLAWSRDGKLLAFDRGMTINDVILISDFR
jgi:Tol biopolymer transport system component/DNA-binding winged helix-turn-helix (wHTH) protein